MICSRHVPVTTTLISIIITIYHQVERVGYNIRAQYQGRHYGTETGMQVGRLSFIHQDPAVGSLETPNKI